MSDTDPDDTSVAIGWYLMMYWASFSRPITSALKQKEEEKNVILQIKLL